MIENNVHFETIQAAYPRIAQKIKLFWGYPEFITLMDDLQNDLADRPRAGFPAPIVSALFALSEQHDTIFPHLAKKHTDIWSLK